MLDTLRGYAAVATGLAEAGARMAWDTVGSLGRSEDDEGSGSLPGKVQDVAGDMVSTGRQSTELLTSLVRTEVDRAVGRLGFVREEELAALRRHVERLEAQVAKVSTETPAPKTKRRPTPKPGTSTAAASSTAAAPDASASEAPTSAAPSTDTAEPGPGRDA